MKYRLLLLVMLIGVFSLASAQRVINEFDEAPADTNYWAWFEHVNDATHHGGHYNTNVSADSTLGWVHYSYVNDPVFSGTGAMQLDWSTHNSESWGGYSKLEHWNPDSNGVYNWAAFDTVAFYYYVVTPASLPNRVHLRFNLHDVSDSPNGNNTYDVADCEYYYSFHYVLDNTEPGWNEIKIPLISGDYWSGEGFNLTGWSGIYGNSTLDKDKIKGFSIEFSMNGAGEGDYATGTVVLDRLVLTGPSEISIIYFNGKTIPGNVDLSAGWSNTGSWELTDEEDWEGGTTSIKWNTPSADWAVWDGLVFTTSDPQDLWYSWTVDSVKFKIKAEAGMGDLKLVFADPDEDGFVDDNGDGADDTPDLEFEAGYMLAAADVGYDGTWKSVEIPLSAFNRFDGGWDGTGTRPGEMDSTKVYRFKILCANADALGKTVYLDNIWTDNPAIDNQAPPPPANVTGIASDYYNLVTWEDVPDETGESYTVYASTAPITDITDPSLDIIASGVLEGIQTAVHWLYYPLEDKDVTYYYAVTCTDASGNVSDPGLSGDAIVNTAQGIPTISLDPPADFSADGDLTEWYNSGIMPFSVDPVTGYVPTGVVTDETDLSGTIFLAADDDYLYVAIDVVDDVYNWGEGNWWDQDAFQIFIGLYDWRGPRHSYFHRGSEPDLSIYLSEVRLQHDTGGFEIFTPDSADYFFEGYNPDYVAEARIPFARLKLEEDELFHPMNGMRIPLDLYFHDNDGSWEGNVGWSHFSTDHQWQNPQEWAYTWIGDTTEVVAIDQSSGTMAYSYRLGNNYPNPFNPATCIEYSLQTAGHVKLTIYDLLGKEVEQLVNRYQPAGEYRITWNPSGIATGVYFYRIETDGFVQTKKMIYMK